MPDSLATIRETNISVLVDRIISGAKDYCQLSPELRQEYIDSGQVYRKLEVWAGRIITANPITSGDGYDLNITSDFVLMNGPSIEYAIQAIVQCLIAGLKDRFVTQTNRQGANDMLLWEITKSS